MTRRPMTIILAAALALTAATARGCRVAVPDPDPLPSGWMPEGITAGAGTTIYVGSLAGGGVWRGDVRTGLGDVFVPAWGGAATGVEYEATANRLWVAGGPTGTVRVYDATTGELLRAYTFAPAGFLNDLVVTDAAVYVTDSFNAWLDVIPLGPNGELPATDAVTTLPLSGITFETRPIQRERHRGDARLAAGRRFVHGRSLPGGSRDGDRDGGLDRRHERDQRGWPRAARRDAVRGAQQRPARRGVPARSGPDHGDAAGRDQLAGSERADDRGGPGRPAVGGQRPVRHPDRRLLGHPGADARLGAGQAGRYVAITTPLVVVTEIAQIQLREGAVVIEQAMAGSERRAGGSSACRRR